MSADDPTPDIVYTGEDGFTPGTPEPEPDVEIEAARAALLAATTIAQTKARTVALFDLLNTTPGEPHEP